MKKTILVLLATLFGISSFGQGIVPIGQVKVSSDGQIIANGNVSDSLGNVTINPYYGVVTSSAVPDGYWVIQPIVDGVNTDSMRWILLERPKSRNISSAVATLRADDPQKTINLTSTSSRTIYLPDPTWVNTTDPIEIKDASNSAATSPITVISLGSATIDGASSYVISTNGDSRGFYKSGNNYKVK